MSQYPPQNQMPGMPSGLPAAPAATGKRKYKSTGIPGMDRLSSFGPRESFFIDGIKFGTPGQNAQISGRILPAFNNALSTQDPQFKRSFVDYRVCTVAQMTEDLMDKEHNVPLITPWVLPLSGYRFFGQSKLDIVSPLTHRIFPDMMGGAYATSDPIDDVRRHVWFKFKNDAGAKKFYFESETNKESPIIPSVRQFAVFNMWGRIKADEQQGSNFLAYVGKAGIGDMMQRLAYPSPHGYEPRDKKWPHFLYGDVTHPITGLWAYSSLVPCGGTDAWSLMFSPVLNSHQGIQVTPVNDSILEARYVLDSKIYRWRSYQEIVDIMVADGQIPNEFIKAACSRFANVGNSPNQTAVHFPPPVAPPVGHPAPQYPQPASQYPPAAANYPRPAPQYPQTASQYPPAAANYPLPQQGPAVDPSMDHLDMSPTPLPAVPQSQPAHLTAQPQAFEDQYYVAAGPGQPMLSQSPSLKSAVVQYLQANPNAIVCPVGGQWMDAVKAGLIAPPPAPAPAPPPVPAPQAWQPPTQPPAIPQMPAAQPLPNQMPAMPPTVGFTPPLPGPSMPPVQSQAFNQPTMPGSMPPVQPMAAPTPVYPQQQMPGMTSPPPVPAPVAADGALSEEEVKMMQQLWHRVSTQQPPDLPSVNAYMVLERRASANNQRDRVPRPQTTA